MRNYRIDPFLLVFVIIVILGILHVTALPKSHEELKESRHPTTYSQSRYGTQGLFLVMEKLGKDTRRWSRPYPLLDNEEVGTLVVINPTKPISPREADALNLWLSRGGRMLFLKSGDWEIKSSGYQEEGVSFLEAFEDHHQITFIRDPSKVMNQSLKEEPSDCIAFIENLLAYQGPIYFDEYHLNNGEGSSVFELMRKFFRQPVGWGALHVIIVFLVYLMCSSNDNKLTPKKIKKQANLVKERAAFLRVSKAHMFAEQVIQKYRSNTSDSS